MSADEWSWLSFTGFSCGVGSVSQTLVVELVQFHRFNGGVGSVSQTLVVELAEFHRL